MPELSSRDVNNNITLKEVRTVVQSLKNHKTVGADGIPVEVYKVSVPALNLLHSLLVARIWSEEKVSEIMGVAIFKMIYKRKGSPDNPAKYRCIGLLNSAYKVLSVVMLKRLMVETKGYLKD